MKLTNKERLLEGLKMLEMYKRLGFILHPVLPVMTQREKEEHESKLDDMNNWESYLTYRLNEILPIDYIEYNDNWHCWKTADEITNEDILKMFNITEAMWTDTQIEVLVSFYKEDLMEYDKYYFKKYNKHKLFSVPV